MNKFAITALQVLITLATANTFAQTIPNNSFENWTITGPAESPDGWAGTPGVNKSTDAYAGSFALQIQAGIFANPMTMTQDTLPGIANTGAQGMGPGTGVRGFAFAARPDSIVGWYKYNAAGNDMPVFTVSLSKWDSVNNISNFIGNSMFMGTSQNSYTRFSIPINYTSTDMPDSANIEFSSSNSMPNNPTLGSMLLVDDITFVYNSPTGIISNTANENLFTVYPNPASDKLFVKFNEANQTASSINIIDAQGRKKLTPTISEVQNGIDISHFSKGIYIIQLADENSKQVTSKTFLVQ